MAKKKKETPKVAKKSTDKKKVAPKKPSAAKSAKSVKPVKKPAPKKPEKDLKKKKAAPAPVKKGKELPKKEKKAPVKPSKELKTKAPAPKKIEKKEEEKKLKAKVVAPEPEKKKVKEPKAKKQYDEGEEFLEEFEKVDPSEVGSSDRWDKELAKPAEIIPTNEDGQPYCRAKECDQISTVEGYCRYHYLLLWKKIQTKRKILADGKLMHYVEELTGRYPDKYLEMIYKDLKSEKDFVSAIQELEIDESTVENEFDDEQSLIDEVRGISDGTPTSAAEEEEF